MRIKLQIKLRILDFKIFKSKLLDLSKLFYIYSN